MGLARILQFNFWLATIVAICGCSWNKKQETANVKAIKYDGILLTIPAGYEQASVNDLILTWRNSDADPEVIEQYITDLETLRAEEGAFLLLIDKSNLRNNILVFRSSYIKVTRYTKQELFLGLEKSLRTRAEQMGSQSKLVESRYYSLTNGVDVLKIKFRFSNTIEETYGTEYIVSSSDGQTAGIVVNHATDDFETLIKKTNFQKDYLAADPEEDYLPTLKSAHPYAQEILRDFFFWNDSDPTSPFSNEDGYATFNAFRKWRAKKGHLPVASYVDTVIVRQGYPRFNLWAVKPADIVKQWDDVHWSYMLRTDQAIVTIAFSQFVLEGKIEEGLRDLARNALRRESSREMMMNFEKDYQSTREADIVKMLQAIERM